MLFRRDDTRALISPETTYPWAWCRYPLMPSKIRESGYFQQHVGFIKVVVENERINLLARVDGCRRISQFDAVKDHVEHGVLGRKTSFPYFDSVVSGENIVFGAVVVTDAQQEEYHRRSNCDCNFSCPGNRIGFCFGLWRFNGDIGVFLGSGLFLGSRRRGGTCALFRPGSRLGPAAVCASITGSGRVSGSLAAALTSSMLNFCISSARRRFISSGSVLEIIGGAAAATTCRAGAAAAGALGWRGSNVLRMSSLTVAFLTGFGAAFFTGAALALALVASGARLDCLFSCFWGGF
jgi:hypothetical protein